MIGADGRNSAVAKQVDAPVTQALPAISVWYFSYWSGVPATGLSVHVRDRTAIFAFPTDDGLFGVFIAWPLCELARVKADIEGSMYDVLDGVPELAERVRAGRREDRLAGATQLPNFVRKPHGPGWALVGDAGCHKDPFMALGVCDAFRDAELLAETLVAGAPLDEFERRRDEATLPDFERNFGAAHLVAPPELLAMRQSLRGDQEATNRFFMAFEGMI